jgi:homoserine kinase type II
MVTLYEKRVDPRDLPFFLGLMDHLAEGGINCPRPIHARDGNALRTLAGKPAAVTSFLQGMWPRRTTVQHCGPVGEALAGLHLAGRDFALRRPNALSVAGWRPVFEGSRRYIDPVLDRELASELDFFEANWPTALPAGVIHADLFNDNVFFLHERLSGIIDFYFACNDFLAYDVAICLNAWCFEPDNAFNATKARALLQAYDKVRPLGADERQALPILARGSALRFMLTRLYDWVHTPADALVKRKDPNEYLAKLRFHRGVGSLADYGL